jgi:mevalonate kinase
LKPYEGFNKSKLEKKYPAKLLLFGEHSVLRGSQALAVPFRQFSGQWAYSDDLSKQYDLPKLVDYVKKMSKNGEIALDTEGVKKELSKGLYFESNVPRGYGLGSSGALVAALYDTFNENKSLYISEIKKVLGAIESYFHGASSGFDPLISYVQKPVLIKPDKTMAVLDDLKSDAQMFLLDTHQPRKAETLIKLFLDKCEQDGHYNALIENDLVPHIDDAIAAFLQNKTGLLFETVHQISYFQYRFFTEMIPLAYKNVWLEGLAGDVFKLKLCGAGGGGFILGFCKNFIEAKNVLSKSGFTVLPITKIS